MKVKSEHIWIVAGTVIIITVLFAAFPYESKKNNQPPPDPGAYTLADITIKGTVEKYGSNPDRDIDKLLFKKDEKVQWLHFPPHTAKAVLTVAHVGNVIEASVQDSRKPAPDGVAQKELLSVTNTATGKIFVTHNIPPPPPAQGTELTINGNILGFNTDEKGNTRSMMVNHWLVILPPQVRNALAPLLVKGVQITVKGWARNAEAGFVNEDSLTIVRPCAIAINGIQYSIQ